MIEELSELIIENNIDDRVCNMLAKLSNSVHDSEVKEFLLLSLNDFYCCNHEDSEFIIMCQLFC